MDVAHDVRGSPLIQMQINQVSGSFVRSGIVHIPYKSPHKGVPLYAITFAKASNNITRDANAGSLNITPSADRKQATLRNDKLLEQSPEVRTFEQRRNDTILLL